MDTLNTIEAQECIEKQYSRKHIDGYITSAIQNNPDMQNKITQGITLVNEYMGKQYYASKNARIAQISNLHIPSLVLSIFIGIAYCQREELFTSVTAQLAGRLKLSDKTAAITTIAEIVAVLCMTDAFDICKAERSASLMVISRIPLDAELIKFIDNTQYLPPMLCKPIELTDNYTSGYLTHNDSLLLGNGNHHDGDLCLDVLNKVNSVQLKLAEDFLCKVEEEPTFDLDTPEKQEQWYSFKKQSYRFYTLLARHDNRFYLTHKVDKRGRIYSQGYHVNVQGTAFKKASIELAKEEVIEGVP